MGLRISTDVIESACLKAMERIGVSKKGSIRSLPIAPDFSGWIGLNVGKHAEFIRINPFVGIHCVPVMQMVAQARGKKYRPNEIPTFPVFLGTLCPDVEQFIFSDETNVEREAERLTSCIEEFGVPYLHSIANLSSLLPLLKEQVRSLGGYPQRYAAALYLSGKPREAIEFIGSQVEALDGQNLSIVINDLKALQAMISVEIE